MLCRLYRKSVKRASSSDDRGRDQSDCAVRKTLTIFAEESSSWSSSHGSSTRRVFRPTGKAGQVGRNLRGWDGCTSSRILWHLAGVRGHSASDGPLPTALRKDLPFRKVFFVVRGIHLCVWNQPPDGRCHFLVARLTDSQGFIKLFTAIVSWMTVFALIAVVPRVLAMRSADETERGNHNSKECRIRVAAC